MKYFDTQSILLSVALSFLYGCMGGCTYPVIKRLLAFVTSVIRQPYLTLMDVLKRTGALRKDHAAEPKKTAAKSRRVLEQVLDFLFVLLFGIGYVLLLYITLDGMLRIYTLLLIGIGFFLCKRYLGALVSHLLDWLLPYIQRVLSWVLFLFFYPIIKLFVCIAKVTVVPLSHRLHEYTLRRRSQNIRRKKIKEVSNLFAKQTKLPNRK